MVKIKIPHWLAQNKAHPMVVEGVIKKETDKAYLISTDYGEDWYPKSQTTILGEAGSATAQRETITKPKRETYAWVGNLDAEWEEFTVFIDPFNSKKVKITVEVIEDSSN